MLIHQTGSFINPKFIVNFPTKRHWKGKSQYDDIENGLKTLAENIQSMGIKSIAIHPLGCGVEWQNVKTMIEQTLSNLPEVTVVLYEPKGAPAAKDMLNRTEKPKLTVAIALFIKLIHQYSQYAYRLTLLEIQKLAYFLQEAGQPLKLNYIKHLYGPYAHNLNKVLELLEGHYITSYGDTQKPDVEIQLLPGAVEDADAFLAEHKVEKNRLEKVESIVDGFETTYGMELLSSIHWVLKYDQVENTEAAVINALKMWNKRKSNLFLDKHIKVAYERLLSETSFSTNY